MYGRYKYLLFILILLFNLSLVFAEDLTAFYPSSKHISPEEFDMQTTIPKTAANIKKEFFRIPYSCQAVRENDLSYCNNYTGVVKDCQQEAKLIMDIRSVSEGRCSKLDIFPGDVCEALKKGDCSGLKDKVKMDICQAFIERNSDLLNNQIDRSDRRFKDLVGGADELINIYYGFKFYSLAACDRSKSWKQGGDYLQKIICKVLFAPESPQKIIDDIALDLAYFQYAKEVKKDMALCNTIRDAEIKEACRNSKAKDLLTFIEGSR